MAMARFLMVLGVILGPASFAFVAYRQHESENGTTRFGWRDLPTGAVEDLDVWGEHDHFELDYTRGGIWSWVVPAPEIDTRSDVWVQVEAIDPEEFVPHTVAYAVGDRKPSGVTRGTQEHEFRHTSARIWYCFKDVPAHRKGWIVIRLRRPEREKGGWIPERFEEEARVSYAVERREGRRHGQRKRFRDTGRESASRVLLPVLHE